MSWLCFAANSELKIQQNNPQHSEDKFWEKIYGAKIEINFLFYDAQRFKLFLAFFQPFLLLFFRGFSSNNIVCRYVHYFFTYILLVLLLFGSMLTFSFLSLRSTDVQACSSYFFGEWWIMMLCIRFWGQIWKVLFIAHSDCVILAACDMLFYF